jgi:plastocyanin
MSKKGHHMEPNSQDTTTQTANTQQSPNRRIIRLAAVALVVVLVIAGLWLALKTDNKSSTDNETPIAAVGTAHVSITSAGFSPATLQIKSGTQVTWTNMDSANHQVAADPHPTHTSIKDFDSTVVLSKNDTFSFIFSKAGTYNYHDHLNLQTKGTIIVQ